MQHRSIKLIVTGTLAFDYISNLPGRFRDYIKPDQLHILNISFNTNNMRKSQGGTGGNIAYTLALLGYHPLLLSAAGSDSRDYKRFLEKTGVNCQHLRVTKEQLTSVGFCVTDQDDNQVWSFAVNAAEKITQLSLKPLLNSPLQEGFGRELSRNGSSPLARRGVFVVISPSGPDGVSHFLKECIATKTRYLFDPAFAIPALTPEELIDGVTHAEIVIGNDYEINFIKQKTGLTEKQILGDNRMLITTLGAKGSRIQTMGKNSPLERGPRNEGGVLSVDVPPAKLEAIVDPAGAGDAYRAGFLAGYLKDLPLETCGRMGSLAAAYTVEKYGTTTHMFTAKQFQARYYKNFANRINW